MVTFAFFVVATKGPKRPRFGPILGPNKIWLNYRQMGCPERCNGMPCSYSTDTAHLEASNFWPQKTLLGALDVLRQPWGAWFGPNCHLLVGRIHIICSGFLRDLALRHFWGHQKAPIWSQKDNMCTSTYTISWVRFASGNVFQIWPPLALVSESPHLSTNSVKSWILWRTFRLEPGFACVR